MVIMGSDFLQHQAAEIRLEYELSVRKSLYLKICVGTMDAYLIKGGGRGIGDEAVSIGIVDGHLAYMYQVAVPVEQSDGVGCFTIM